MLYKFNLTLTNESKLELTRTKGKIIHKITKDGFGVLIKLDYGSESIFIRNNVDLHPDYNDEYVQFVVSKDCEWAFENISIYSIDKMLKDIQLVTDYVIWKFKDDIWKVKADIGILFTLEDGEEILIEVVDSIAGFMRYYQGQDCLKHLRSIEEQWQMKADVLLKKERVIEKLR
jgi:hypothetical protein